MYIYICDACMCIYIKIYIFLLLLFFLLGVFLKLSSFKVDRYLKQYLEQLLSVDPVKCLNVHADSLAMNFIETVLVFD